MTEHKLGTPLTCESARHLIAARPDTDADRLMLSEHVNGCAACSEYQELQRVLDHRLVNSLVMEPPAWLTASIMDRLNPVPMTPRWARPRINLPMQWSFYILLSG